MTTENMIRLLTGFALFGLLLGVGLRLTWSEVVAALRQCRLTLVLAVNFVVVPALAVALCKLFGVAPQTTFTGIILLAAAPFAPVVPVFTRMAKADLALAAGLTSAVPLLSAFLTPLVCYVCLRTVSNAGALQLDLGGTLLVLAATILLPMAIGLLVHRASLRLRDRILRPLEITSEAAGAISLAFVTFTEFKGIISIGWPALMVMLLVSEVGLLLGYWAGHGPAASRRVVALGTANRNIALALLLALQNFPGTQVAAAVVAGGLVLIFAGLAHVAWWRFGAELRKSQ